MWKGLKGGRDMKMDGVYMCAYRSVCVLIYLTMQIQSFNYYINNSRSVRASRGCETFMAGIDQALSLFIGAGMQG